MIIEKSLINCHIKGLHSIILSENPIRRIFFTTPDHELRNSNSIAIHPHHCDIALVPMWGKVYNIRWNIHFTKLNTPDMRKEYLYQSKILSGEGKFIETGRKGDMRIASKLLLDEVPEHLHSSVLHTIYTEQDRAAWLVLEGQEDKSYLPVCYSREQPVISTELYQPMTREFLDKNFRS